jgi:3-oxoacyl-(acyl-carrier-protein) synthase
MTAVKRRVVVTGLGVIAPNGNNVADFGLALRKGTSGIRYQQVMEEAKFACRVAGAPRGVDELAEATFD